MRTPILIRPVLALTALLVQWCCAVSVGRGDFREDFAAPSPAWQVEAGPSVQLIDRRRLSEGTDKSLRFEQIRVVAASGYSAPLAYGVEAIPIIDETGCECRIRCNQPGVQLGLRIEFPRSKNAATGRTVSTIVHGSRYTEVGRWQTLTVKEIPLLAERNARMMRTVPGQQVDTREAFVSHVVLLAPGGPGATVVDVCELNLAGVGPSAMTSVLVDAAGSQSGPQLIAARAAALRKPLPPIEIRIEAQTVQAEGKPFLPRLLEYHGESLELVRELGFNGIWLAVPPTEALVVSADSLSLWIIAPPPEDMSVVTADSAWRTVLCWQCGDRLTSGDLDITNSISDTIRHRDQNLRRPLSASLAESCRAYDRYADVISLSCRSNQPGSRPLDVGRLVGRARRELGAGCVVLAEIELDRPASLATQLAAFDVTNKGVDKGGSKGWIEPAIVRDNVIESIAAGARGYVMRTSRSIAGEQLEARRLRLHLAEVNGQVARSEAWLARGGAITSLTDSKRRFTAHMWQLDRTRLCVPVARDEWPRGDGVTVEPVSFVAPGVPITSAGYRLALSELLPVPLERQAGGAAFKIDPRWQNDLLLLTDDARAAQAIRNDVRKAAPAAVRLRRDRLQADLAALSALHDAMPRHRQSVATADLLPLAEDLLTQINLAATAGDLSRATGMCDELGLRLDQAFAVMKRQVVATVENESIPTAYVSTAWPMHIELTDIMPQLPRGANLLAGGNFEQLHELQRFGWRHTQRADSHQESAVSLTSDSPHTGAAALRLATRPRGGNFDEGPSVWIESPPLKISPGDLVEITGWARVAPNSGTAATLEVFDTLGTVDLAVTIKGTGTWQPFRLIRKSDDEHRLQLTFALSGSGIADIDAVMIQNILPRPAELAKQPATR